MSTMPMGQPKGAAQVGQTGLPGNTANTVPMNYNFMPHASASTTGAGSTIPTATPLTTQPYTANNFLQNNPANPFNQYTGFNLGLNSADELTKMYGPLGTAMYYYLNNGAGYNSSVLTSLINQIQPQVEQGLATLGSTAGMTGNRFGSAYELGTSNFLSQVNQNELGMASGLYQQSQNTINNDLVNLLSGAGQFQSNKGGFGSSLLSSLLPALAGPISGGITDLLNLIPGVNIPTGGSGGGITLPGGIRIPIGGSGSTIPGGNTTGGTPPYFPGNPTYNPNIIWDTQTQTNAGNATAGQGGDIINAQTGQTMTNDEWLQQQQMQQLMNVLWSQLPGGQGGGGSDVPTDNSGGTLNGAMLPPVVL